MNLRAAGAYLRELRDLNGYSQSRVGAEAGVTADIVLRVEKGRGETSGSALLKMLRFLGGSCEHWLELLADDSISEDQAKVMAKAWHANPVGHQATKVEEDALRLFNTMIAISEHPTIEERARALRELPAWMFRVIEPLALDLMRSTVRRE